MPSRTAIILALLEADPVSLIDQLTNLIDRCMNETRPDMAERKQFLELHGLRHSVDNVIRPARKKLVEYQDREADADAARNTVYSEKPDLNHVVPHIAKVCDRLELSLDDISSWNAVPTPWNMARFRDEIIVLICEREVKKLSGSHANRLRRLAFAHHDVIAYSRISDFVGGLANRPHVRMVPVPHNLEPKDAWQLLCELLEQKPAGIISVGSANGNPVSDVASRKIFDLKYDAPRDTEAEDTPILPAHFVWGHEVRNDFLAYASPASKRPGIRFLEPACDDLQRETKGNGVPDAGMMLLDARTRPFVCVLAGHGGLGTLAATESFLDTDSIAEKLHDSADLHIFHAMTKAYRDRVFNIVEVGGEPAGDPQEWFQAPPMWETETDVFWRYSFE